MVCMVIMVVTLVMRRNGFSIEVFVLGSMSLCQRSTVLQHIAQRPEISDYQNCHYCEKKDKHGPCFNFGVKLSLSGDIFDFFSKNN